jgi:hypothetical protein
MKAKKRDIRRELWAMIRRDIIIPISIARECQLDEDRFDAWLDGGNETPEFIETVREFIDARNRVKHALVNAPNPIRAELGGKMIGNVGLLVSELEKAPEDQRSKIHDHISLYLLDLRRLFELMAMERGGRLNDYL